MKKFRVSIIGCGHRARAHIDGFKMDERCEIVSLADVNIEAAKKLKEDYSLSSNLYSDYKEMFSKEKPDIAVICLWTKLHLPVFRDCAQAGIKIVMSEKPMAHTWGDCKKISQIAENTGCMLTFCHQRRYAKGNRFVRQAIKEGMLGEIVRMDLYSPPNLLDCGTHTIDQAFSFNNETPVKWVLGAVDTSETLNWFDVKAECMAIGMMVYENGVRANIQVGGPDMDIWGGVRVTGTKGFFEVYWDGEFGNTVLYDNPDWKPPVFYKDNQEKDVDTMAQYVKDVIDCFEKGQEPDTSYKKALKASEVIYSFYESVRRNARVVLPLENVEDNPFITMLEQGRFNN